MTELDFINLVLLPIGLGLLGFVEPCSIGSSLVFVKYIEGKKRLAKLSQVMVFMLTRGLFIGLLGAAAAGIGTAFLGFQKAAWIVLGTIYAAIGLFYLVGKAGFLMRTFGPRLSALANGHGPAALGILFGLNIPACAAPLIFVLFGMAAAGGASGRAMTTGFISLALFGLALSLPLVLAVAFAPARRALDGLAGLSRRIPFWTGLVLIGLGAWSIGFAFFVNLEDWTRCHLLTSPAWWEWHAQASRWSSPWRSLLRGQPRTSATDPKRST